MFVRGLICSHIVAWVNNRRIYVTLRYSICRDSWDNHQIVPIVNVVDFDLNCYVHSTEQYTTSRLLVKHNTLWWNFERNLNLIESSTVPSFLVCACKRRYTVQRRSVWYHQSRLIYCTQAAYLGRGTSMPMPSARYFPPEMWIQKRNKEERKKEETQVQVVAIIVIVVVVIVALCDIER